MPNPTPSVSHTRISEPVPAARPAPSPQGTRPGEVDWTCPTCTAVQQFTGRSASVTCWNCYRAFYFYSCPVCQASGCYLNHGRTTCESCRRMIRIPKPGFASELADRPDGAKPSTVAAYIGTADINAAADASLALAGTGSAPPAQGAWADPEGGVPMSGNVVWECHGCYFVQYQARSAESPECTRCRRTFHCYQCPFCRSTDYFAGSGRRPCPSCRHIIQLPKPGYASLMADKNDAARLSNIGAWADCHPGQDGASTPADSRSPIQVQPPHRQYGAGTMGSPPYAAARVMPVAPATNGMAIASLVFGVFWMFGLGSVLAVIFGFIAKKQIEESDGTQGGQGLAIAGLVLGFFGVAMFVIAIIALAAASTSLPQYPTGP